jgi:hypothetical protein
LLLRGDHDMNEVKVGKLPGLAGFRFATVPEIEAHFGCKPGYLGPIGLKQPVKLVADREVAVMADWICGANAVDFHLTGVNWGRDVPEPALVADIRKHAPQDWRASAEVLRRRYRRNWGDVVRQEVSGPNGGPIEIAAEQVTRKLLPELVVERTPAALEHADESGTGGAEA